MNTKTLFNAESNESTLRTIISNKIDYSERVKSEKKKAFPYLTFGNNRESPDYMRLPNIGTNNFTARSKFSISKPAPLKIDDELIKTVNKFSTKNQIRFTKNIKISDVYFNDNDIANSNYRHFLTKPSQNESNEIKNPNIFKPGLIKPVLNSNQTAYLKNVNEYDIKENYNMNEDRHLKFNYHKKSDFDIVKNIKRNHKPHEITLEKWPQFYESYYSLKTSENSFKKKAGLFTNYANANMLPISKVGKVSDNKYSPKNYNIGNHRYNFSTEKKKDIIDNNKYGRIDDISRIKNTSEFAKRKVSILSSNTINKQPDNIYNNNF